MSTKYVFITGGVVSSLGKGTTAASLARLLKLRGYNVAMQKMDPYYNVDPGLLSPLQHGEAFITDDGVAADLDLGHYERLGDVRLSGLSSVTTGKIHRHMMEKERHGEYKGATIQVIPHVTNEIKQCIRRIADTETPDILITEIGGTVGDMEASPYLEAIRQFKWDVGEENCCFIHVTLLPFISAAGELKTKPTQHSVKTLRSIGIQPNIIVCRTEIPISREAKNKMALFCNVKAQNVITNMDCESLYELPMNLEKEGLADDVLSELSLERKPADLTRWKEITYRAMNPESHISVGMIGKYVSLRDAYLSVIESLNHAGIERNVKVDLTLVNPESLTNDNLDEMLGGFKAVVMPGGYGKRGAEQIIMALKYAREHKIPTLMIGYGMQLGLVELTRSLLGEKSANSREVEPDCSPVVCEVPAERICEDAYAKPESRMGGSDIALAPNSKIAGIYGCEKIRERHGNRYEIIENTVKPLEKHNVLLSGRDTQTGYIEAFEVTDAPMYIGVIYHPEFLSRPDSPHPLFVELLKKAMER
ncbi:MAG: CTP synthase [Eubacteriales bacterium]|nr:CTP synthase [Eubacteriales bacterium]MDD4512609.1 CTP synthase [Eubacteriales bacterium]